LSFILVPVTTTENSEKGIAVAIAIPSAVVATVIIAIVFYYRCVIKKLEEASQDS